MRAFIRTNNMKKRFLIKKFEKIIENLKNKNEIKKY